MGPLQSPLLYHLCHHTHIKVSYWEKVWYSDKSAVKQYAIQMPNVVEQKMPITIQKAILNFL